MSRLLLLLIPLLTSCTQGTSGSCQNPVHDACTEKAAQVAPELAKIAAQQQRTPDEMSAEYVNACEGQLQSDLDQTLADLQAISISNADAGKAHDQ